VNSQIEHNLQKREGIFVRCECGFKILLVPDLNMMTNAIENHAAQHGKIEKDTVKATFDQQRIEVYLIAQTLKAAADFTEEKPL
jgi:hypothetical protein